MQRRLRLLGLSVVCAAAAAAVTSVGIVGQTTNGEWRTYGGDLASTRYSPLDQVNKDNFNKLEIAWRLRTDSLGPRPEFNLQGTPLMVGGVVYATAGTRRAVVALDAGTGELLWMHSENEGERGSSAPRQLSGRGLSYWADPAGGGRIVYVTPGYRLIALDAKTGVPVQSFGQNGAVDLKDDDDQVVDPIKGEIGLHATPIISNDVIVVGAAHLAGGAPASFTHVKGYVRGYDVRTGKRIWIFHTIPSPGEYGYDTWEADSASYTGNAGVWAQMSVDPDLGMVYLPVELPTGDYYGGHRPGNGLFGESLLAVDIKTGQRKWHYQLVHHGIWDMDIPCAPILANITVDGRQIKAIAQPTKQGWVYVFDRVTGQPVWPIEERPVEQSTVPGEKTSATQPFPTKPPAFDRQGVSEADLIDFTPALHQQALEIIKNYKIGPLFTPPVVSTWPGPLATLHLPSVTGGANWQGGSLDPETNILYIFSNTAPTALGLVPSNPDRSDFGWVQGRATPPAPPAGAAGGRGGRGAGGRGAAPAGRGGGRGNPLAVEGLPLIKPPYGRITALNLNQGTMVWQIAHGDTPDDVKNNPALKGIDIPRTGSQGRIGVLTTKTLVIAGEGEMTTQPSGERAAKLRAYDKATGADAGAVLMPAPQTGSPMTYMYNGKQYIIVAVSGGSSTGEYLAYKLP